MIPVVWYTLDPDSIARGYWDQGVLEDLFRGDLWPLPADFAAITHATDFDGISRIASGAVVVVPGRFHADKVPILNAQLANLRWVLLIVTSDEERLFPLDQLDHPNLRLWVQTATNADPGYHFGVGYPPGLREVSRTRPIVHKPLSWAFSGQMTHPRRRDAGKVLQRLEGGRFHATPGFTQGMDQGDYWEMLADTKTAPCPSGPVTPDTFRAWEALELGCFPILDGRTPAGQNDYWKWMGWPYPAVLDWREAPALIAHVEDVFPMANARALAWWVAQKRAMARRFRDDYDQLTAPAVYRSDDVNELITVIVPTSPIPSHPSTELISDTVESVRRHLPDAEILITADGGNTTEEYADYLWRLVRICHQNPDWAGVLPILHDRHLHQSGMMTHALDQIRTPLVLYVEHDTPLLDLEIEWDALIQGLLDGDMNAVRFHHEAQVLDVHRHLMVGSRPVTIGHGARHHYPNPAPVLRCAQWSQRPHLARTDFYRWIIARHFDVERPQFIEDVMHSVLDCAWRDEGFAGWDRYRLAMYAPPGDIKRSTHLDGRRHQ